MSYYSAYKGNLASQPPLRKVNQEYYNPFVHTPPTGLEKNIILRSIGPRKPLSVTQKVSYEPKLGEDANKDEDYGQFLEIGGRRKRKTKRSKSRKSNRSNKSKSRKSNKSKSRKSKRSKSRK
jgi:hypothetical protein